MAWYQRLTLLVTPYSLVFLIRQLKAFYSIENGKKEKQQTGLQNPQKCISEYIIGFNVYICQSTRLYWSWNLWPVAAYGIIYGSAPGPSRLISVTSHYLDTAWRSLRWVVFLTMVKAEMQIGSFMQLCKQNEHFLIMKKYYVEHFRLGEKNIEKQPLYFWWSVMI